MRTVRIFPIPIVLTASAEAATRWPRELPLEQGTLVVYQPQIENLEGVILSGRMAVSWERRGGSPVFGVVWFDARFLADRPENADRNAQRPSVSTRPAAPAAARPNDVYGDRSGNVYRQNAGGDWDRRTSQGGWEGGQPGAGPSTQLARPQADTRSAPTGGRGSYGGAPAGLNSDAAARNRGGGGGYRGGGGGRRR